ncbi:unnamed protein product, partial [Mesorhabditis belari]|uniref:Uncharacterized protein n=1 Tax=Mesorhabditis belari TaxID=2138241 RepID=A0AAF3EKH1_9BILA
MSTTWRYQDKVKNFDFDTIPLRVTDTNELAEAYTMKATNRPHLYTVFNPLNQIYQWAFLTPKTISPNCVVSLFAGGYPSDKGSEKYRIYDFDANNLPSFSNGFMSTFGFTFFIPSQCEFSILINANGAPPNTELMFAMHTGNEGFFMSNGYRQMDNLQQNQPFIYNLELYNDDWNQNLTKFFFEVVDFNAGDLNDTSFFISYGNNDDDIMLEQSISNQNFSSHTVMAQLRYDAMTDHSYVFVRYKTLGDGTDGG